ncbi:TIM barrel protein [Shouchella sp. 1P09AA]|uniref:sugar phosphate isomerase/epimerase family protein n=1 Tax=unclassified Shouchella TaxID=2893065 RepID=UPI0039A349A0
MNATVGVQMMMLKEKVSEIGVFETMKRLHDLGFSSVEVSQIPMAKENVMELRRASKEFSIDISALSAPLEPMFPGADAETLRDNFNKIVQDCKTLEASYIRIGMLPFSIMGSKDEILGFIDRAEAMANRLKEHNIKLYYHTHHIEFQKYDGEYLLDLMKNNTQTLGFELDVHWIQRAGLNPVNVIEQYKGRIDLLHLKDYRIAPLQVTKDDLQDMSQFFSKFTNLIEFAEIGAGNLNIGSMIDAGLNYGTVRFFIEQDDTYGADPFDCLERSMRAIKTLGYSHLL